MKVCRYSLALAENHVAHRAAVIRSINAWTQIVWSRKENRVLAGRFHSEAPIELQLRRPDPNVIDCKGSAEDSSGRRALFLAIQMSMLIISFRIGNTVQLAVFIRANRERIAAEWELFAATLLPEEEFSRSVLRNGIVEMLTEIANDMDRAQSAGQQQKKSEGDAKRGDGIDTAANKHALERVNMGVSSRHLISEFRALRATIIRLWQPSEAALDKGSVFDLIRFNEAVDQLLVQAAEKFTDEIGRSRDLFLGILGHDLRNPLAAISGWADLQLRAKTLDRQVEMASQILISSSRMAHMITDLIELTRVRSGSGIVLRRAPADMHRICMKAIEEMESIYPDRIFQLNCNDEVSGEWDAARMTQVLSNLLGNSIQHGSTSFPITITAKGNDHEVELAVHNPGAAISPDAIPKLFDSLFQGGSDERAADDRSSSLGLGLYIAKEIISAHGGSIEARSSDDEGTTFIAHLPRRSRT